MDIQGNWLFTENVGQYSKTKAHPSNSCNNCRTRVHILTKVRCISQGYKKIFVIVPYELDCKNSLNTILAGK